MVKYIHLFTHWALEHLKLKFQQLCIEEKMIQI